MSAAFFSRVSRVFSLVCPGPGVYDLRNIINAQHAFLNVRPASPTFQIGDGKRPLSSEDLACFINNIQGLAFHPDQPPTLNAAPPLLCITGLAHTQGNTHCLQLSAEDRTRLAPTALLLNFAFASKKPWHIAVASNHGDALLPSIQPHLPAGSCLTTFSESGWEEFTKNPDLLFTRLVWESTRTGSSSRPKDLEEPLLFLRAESPHSEKPKEPKEQKKPESPSALFEALS